MFALFVIVLAAAEAAIALAIVLAIYQHTSDTIDVQETDLLRPTSQSTMETTKRSRRHPVGWLWLIPLFPLLGAALNGFFGDATPAAFGKRVIHAIAIGAMVLSRRCRSSPFCKMVAHAGRSSASSIDHLWTMFGSRRRCTVDLTFALDPLGDDDAVIVTGVGYLIHVYSDRLHGATSRPTGASSAT